tara:strand:+ start:1816 stop:1941 length:126 start_codon:yes stop_codon:yes gene_type:complete
MTTWERIKKYKKMYTWPMNVIVGEEYSNLRPEGGSNDRKRK